MVERAARIAVREIGDYLGGHPEIADDELYRPRDVRLGLFRIAGGNHIELRQPQQSLRRLESSREARVEILELADQRAHREVTLQPITGSRAGL